jgi:hypothetical protein
MRVSAIRYVAILLTVSACGASTAATTPDAVPLATDAPIGDVYTVIPDVIGGDVSRPDALAPDGAASVGRVQCGMTTCPALSTPQQNIDTEDYCCLEIPGDGDPVCRHGNLGGCESGNPLYCDEAADCAPGLLCCDSAVRAGLFHCADDCAQAMLQLCRSDGECLNHQPCVHHTCGGGDLGFCGEPGQSWLTTLNCQ